MREEKEEKTQKGARDKHRQPETKKKEVLQSSVYIPQPPRQRLSEQASEGATLALTRSASGAPGGRWRLEQNRYSESLLSPSAAREARSVVARKRERKADTCAAIRGSGGGGGRGGNPFADKLVHTEWGDDAAVCFPRKRKADAAVLTGEPLSRSTSPSPDATGCAYWKRGVSTTSRNKSKRSFLEFISSRPLLGL